MFLSQLTFNRMDRQAMQTLSDIYRLHQYVFAGFRQYKPARRVLFRVEPEVNGEQVRLLVQSQNKPDWNQELVEQSWVENVQTKEFELQLQIGGRYRFRLRANPVVTRNGKRYGLIRDESLVEWLQQKEGMLGGRILSVTPIDEGYLRGIKRKSGGENRINIKLARYEGILEVKDPKLLENKVLNGIGPAKAFGCGLLSLAKA